MSLYGLRKAMNLPSGEICAPAISGLPKKISRSISGGRLFCAAAEDAIDRATAATSNSAAAYKKRTFLLIAFSWLAGH